MCSSKFYLAHFFISVYRARHTSQQRLLRDRYQEVAVINLKEGIVLVTPYLNIQLNMLILRIEE